MKTKDNLVNYTLSIGFVLLILIFLGAMIGITKYSLSEKNVVKEHVQSTKNLIEDINEVEKSVVINELNIENTKNIDNLEKISNFNKEINEISYLNIKNNKSIISLQFNTTIEKYENIYYLKSNENSEFKKNDIVLYKSNSLPQIGNIISQKNLIKKDQNPPLYNILNIETQKIQEIENEQILGIIIIKYG